MKLITDFFRFFVGILFIFSGLIKLNDPVGFSFKLEEYFGPTVLDLGFLIPLVLPMAISIVIFEVLVGVSLLIGFKKKYTLWSLLLMIVFFTFLTWSALAILGKIALSPTRHSLILLPIFVFIIGGVIIFKLFIIRKNK